MKILDNITNTVRDDLRVEMKRGSKISVAAACFSMYAYQELKKQLESAIVTLQLIHQYEECPKNISKMLYNQIGVLVFCNE